MAAGHWRTAGYRYSLALMIVLASLLIPAYRYIIKRRPESDLIDLI